MRKHPFACLPACCVLLLCSQPALADRAAVVVTLSFDDTFAPQLEAAEILERHGLRGTFFVNSERLGKKNAFAVDDLRRLRDRGHEIGGHTLTHERLTDVDPEEARAEVCEDRKALVALGFEPVSFAYPFGAFDEEVQRIVERCGYQIARGAGGVRSERGCSRCPTAESLPPADRWHVRSVAPVESEETLETFQRYVLNAQEDRGGWLVFIFHHVCEDEDCAPNAVSPQELEGFAAWLVDQQVPVATVREVIALAGLPRIPPRHPALRRLRPIRDEQPPEVPPGEDPPADPPDDPPEMERRLEQEEPAAPGAGCSGALPLGWLGLCCGAARLWRRGGRRDTRLSP